MATLVVPDLDETPWPTLGGQVADLIEDCAIFGPGSLKGQPAKLDAEKRAALYRMYEVYPQGHRFAGRRRFKRCGISWRKGLAKALALDTRIPTPLGWTLMGDLSVGDLVFDERGRPTTVTAVSDVFLGNVCYRVSFKDGSSIVADADHRWYTEELRHRYAGSIKTTADLAGSVAVRSDQARNHRIPVAGALELPARDLPVDPWVLGAWLGDGRTDDAEFTMHASDHAHFVAQVDAARYFHRPPKVDRRNGVYAVRVSVSPIRRGSTDSLKSRLRNLGVLGNKHVPDIYLRAGRHQRQRLLQGLMDTDGSISCDGSAATFVSTVKPIAAGVYELMCSLGLKPTIKPFTTTAGTSAWKVYVFADNQTPIFSLPRKHDRQRPPCPRTAMSRSRHIVAVEQVPSVPTRCIAVDSESRLYLAGEAMVPTHNTEFMAWVAFAELHPEGPVRCDGFDAHGNPVGRPVRDPYIPLLAVTAEQVEELAYGALYVMCTEGPDAELFDATNERIVRLSPNGTADGKAVPLSNSPGSRDGARTTFQCFDEPHRLVLPRQIDAHETMVANLEKRVLEDPWGLYVGTAGEIGQGSIAEGLHEEGLLIEKGEVDDPQLFYFHREAGAGFDLDEFDDRVAAVAEATGPVGEYGPGQFESIARQWDRPRADKAYLERVWLNRWIKAGRQAFDVKRWNDLATAAPIAPGSFVTWGFDGARYRDSTAIVLTDIPTGRQRLWALWEKPLTADDKWEITEQQVLDSLDELHDTFSVWRGYYDPFYWTEAMRKAAGKYGDKVVVEWRTNRTLAAAWMARRYGEAISGGDVTRCKNDPLAEDFDRHIAAAGRETVNHWDDQGEQLFILAKIHPDRKFDVAMAAQLSWEARLDALKAGAQPDDGPTYFRLPR